MIVTVANVKGGVGKTTLCVNLAVALARSHQVLLIDGDEQGTALAFTQLRAERGVSDYTAIALHGASIRSQVRLQLAGRYEYIVIDVGGRDSGSLRNALLVADLVLIPAVPRSFDLWGVDQTAALVREAREVNDGLRAVAVLNGADHHGQDNTDADAFLGELDGLEVSPHHLGRRKAFPNAAAEGLGILETTSTAAAWARAEFNRLFESLFSERKNTK
jgi:chromosome partitioning protein